jgi:hypothetical protein
LRPIEAEILIKALARIGFQLAPKARPGRSPAKAVPSFRIRLTLSSECPGGGMISPSMPKRDRNTRLSRKLQV